MITIVCFNPMVSALVLEHKRLEVCENKTCSEIMNETCSIRTRASSPLKQEVQPSVTMWKKKKKRRRNATNFLSA